jgi:hypothetical protein
MLVIRQAVTDQIDVQRRDQRANQSLWIAAAAPFSRSLPASIASRRTGKTVASRWPRNSAAAFGGPVGPLSAFERHLLAASIHSASENSTGLMGSGRVRRHPHRRN